MNANSTGALPTADPQLAEIIHQMHTSADKDQRSYYQEVIEKSGKSTNANPPSFRPAGTWRVSAPFHQDTLDGCKK